MPETVTEYTYLQFVFCHSKYIYLQGYLFFSEAGELATGGTKKGIVVSTIAEAEFYAANSFDDILWASPLVKERISK